MLDQAYERALALMLAGLVVACTVPEIRVVERSPEWIATEARKLGLPPDTQAYAVTFVEPCTIFVPFGRPDLVRHERAHCNGWEHP